MSRWSVKRRLSYIFLVLCFIGLVALVGYLVYRPDPTCFDGVKNGDETGIDCGGDCERICTVDVLPIKTLWTRSFAISPNLYSVVAVVENPNLQFGVSELDYTFRLVDEVGQTLATKSGVTILLPQDQLAIFEGNIVTSSPVSRAFVDFEDNPVWTQVDQDEPLLRVFQKEFTQSPTPRLSASVRNETVVDLSDVEVVVVLSDVSGNAFAASRTVVESLPRQSSRDIFFTWPVPFESNPTFIDFYPRLVN